MIKSKIDPFKYIQVTVIHIQSGLHSIQISLDLLALLVRHSRGVHNSEFSIQETTGERALVQIIANKEKRKKKRKKKKKENK